MGAQSIFPQFACSALRFSTAIGKPTVYFGLCADSFVKLIQVAEEQKREAVICMYIYIYMYISYVLCIGHACFRCSFDAQGRFEKVQELLDEISGCQERWVALDDMFSVVENTKKVTEVATFQTVDSQWKAASRENTYHNVQESRSVSLACPLAS